MYIQVPIIYVTCTCRCYILNCAVAENIHATHPKEGHWKSQGVRGRGLNSHKTCMKLNWNVQEAWGGGLKPKILQSGVRDIFWNHTFDHQNLISNWLFLDSSWCSIDICPVPVVRKWDRRSQIL